MQFSACLPAHSTQQPWPALMLKLQPSILPYVSGPLQTQIATMRKTRLIRTATKKGVGGGCVNSLACVTVRVFLRRSSVYLSWGQTMAAGVHLLFVIFASPPDSIHGEFRDPHGHLVTLRFPFLQPAEQVNCSSK